MANSSAETRNGRTLWQAAIAAALAGSILGFTVTAADAVSSRVRKACEKDYLKFCPNYEVDTPQLRNCMSQAGKRRSLSPRCLDALVDSGEIPRKYLSKR
jgi:hypothetical protein